MSRHTYIKVKLDESCPALCDPMDYIVHWILQARILEWVAFPFSRGSSQSRDWNQLSCAAGGFFTSWVTREASVCVCVCVCIHTSTLLHNDCPNEDTDLKLYLKALMEKQKTNKQKNPQGYNCLSKPKFSILLNKVYFHTSNSSWVLWTLHHRATGSGTTSQSSQTCLRIFTNVDFPAAVVRGKVKLRKETKMPR